MTGKDLAALQSKKRLSLEPPNSLFDLRECEMRCVTAKWAAVMSVAPPVELFAKGAQVNSFHVVAKLIQFIQAFSQQ